MKKKEIKLRNVIFSLKTRKFGKVVEKLVEKLLVEFEFIVEPPKDLSHDIIINDSKDEIKGSRVCGKSVLILDDDDIIGSLMSHETDKIINLNESYEIEWDCNIQQIKVKFFNTLWYVLFFGDCVTIFKIDHDQIINDKKISYSDKQHRGNEGEGQFHITNKNIKYHLDKYLVKTLTYSEVYKKMKKKLK